MAWQKGQSGNPRGRPKSARQKLSEGFLRDLQELWKEHGQTVMQRIIDEHPEKFLDAIVRVLPKQIEADVNHNLKADDLTDDELASIAAAAQRKRGSGRAAEKADSEEKLH